VREIGLVRDFPDVSRSCLDDSGITDCWEAGNFVVRQSLADQLNSRQVGSTYGAPSFR